MTPIRQIERRLFPCPEVDTGNLPVKNDLKMYKPIGIFRFGEYNTEEVPFYLFIREFNQENYFDLYFDDSEMRRIVLMHGFQLNDEDEEYFLKMIHHGYWPDGDNSSRIFRYVQVNFPQWSVSSSEDIGIFLEHLYFANHRCGARETLYKAGLSNTAWNLDKLYHYNVMGTTPEKIIDCGVPMKMLRILDGFGSYKLFSLESIERCKKVYHQHSGLIKRNLSRGQWQYLEELLPGGLFENRKFSRALFNRLICVTQNVMGALNNYKQYLELSEKYVFLKDKKIPEYRGVLHVLSWLDEDYLEYPEDNYNEFIAERKKEREYEYVGDKYMVILPANEFSFRVEAMCQGNCVMSYVMEHAEHDTTILFLRKKSEPDMPFVTMEVEGKKVVQAQARFNADVSEEVQEFIDEYEQRLQSALP